MDDLISRKAAIEIASGFCHPANIAKELAKLPSAQPDLDEVYAHAETEAEARYHAERKKGKWINVRHDNIAECDQCGITGRAWMNFCFDCGADMRAERRTDDR